MKAPSWVVRLFVKTSLTGGNPLKPHHAASTGTPISTTDYRSLQRSGNTAVATAQLRVTKNSVFSSALVDPSWQALRSACWLGRARAYQYEHRFELPLVFPVQCFLFRPARTPIEACRPRGSMWINRCPRLPVSKCSYQLFPSSTIAGSHMSASVYAVPVAPTRMMIMFSE